MRCKITPPPNLDGIVFNDMNEVRNRIMPNEIKMRDGKIRPGGGGHLFPRIAPDICKRKKNSND